VRVLNRMAPASAVALVVAALLPTAPAAGAPLVSLGDSYSSGEGAGPFDRGTDSLFDRCHRSANAWPRLLGVPMADHLACSGAKTQNFYKGQTIGGADHVPQLDRLRAIAAQRRIARVLVTIGGNDLGFASIIKDCFVERCLKHIDTVQLPRLRDIVQPAVTRALEAAQKASRGADVVLVGYPDLIAPATTTLAACGSWLSDFEKPRLRRLQRELDAEQRQAAADAGARYISVRRALAGHELCTRDPWVRAIGLHTNLHQEGHPTVDGQHAIADAVSARLSRAA
jgi:lysophospholipase L1-like esterase